MSEPRFYQVCVVRRRPVADESHLIGPVERLVRGVQAEGAELIQLFAYSPAHRLYRILEGGTSNLDKFVMTSQIQWATGAGPGNPLTPTPLPLFDWERGVMVPGIRRIRWCSSTTPTSRGRTCACASASFSKGWKRRFPGWWRT